jgi:divalent metal cation (Fe/Co/Zn/Cd) transporter
MSDEQALPRSGPEQAAGVERWGWYSIGVNIVLAGINLGIALASGSLAVEAEQVHNLVDLLSAIGMLIGLKLSTRKTNAFPYGLCKLENVIAVVLAGMTFVTCVGYLLHPSSRYSNRVGV